MISSSSTNIIADGIAAQLFPENYLLLSGVTEVYELELAYLESRLLTEEEIIKNGAYFAGINNRLTRHYLMCKGEPIKLPQYSSARLKSFFQTNQFKTGYATHGLFPYRGKFHPQMIKALMNIIGLKPGDRVVDPMMGSGTVLLEARLMGINSIGVDISPFCCFMTQVKLDALTIPLGPLRVAQKNSRKVFEFLKNNMLAKDLLFAKELFKIIDIPEIPEEKCALSMINFLLLVYLDSVGYSERSNNKSQFEQFNAILERYLFVVNKIQLSINGTVNELAEAEVLEGDARCLSVKDNSIDGIIFSPPYSFAVDYLENDMSHLKYLKVDLEILHENMVGLRGRTLQNKFDFYQKDMRMIISECARILRPEKFGVIIIGTNDNQLSKIQGKPAEDIQGLDDLVIEIAEKVGLKLIRKIERQITGIANTMRKESIVILQKNAY